MNKTTIHKIVNRLVALNNAYSPYDKLIFGFTEGRGHWVKFPKNLLTRLLYAKKLYITKRTYTQVSFLITQYSKAHKNYTMYK